MFTLAFTANPFKRTTGCGNRVVSYIYRQMMACSNHYSSAIEALNSLQSNADVIAKIISSRDTQRHLNIPNMTNYLKRCGIHIDDLSRLSVIHISGTKGKGSTSAFCESILGCYGYKTGMFTSPHLVSVTERFRLNGRSIDEMLFSKYFWDVYNQLDATKETLPHQDRPMPSYFMMLTVMAFYMFLKEDLDAIILEVGVGGEYDSTNVIKDPVVCGVTSLGLDHTSVLGNTIDKIAWQKAGIFKSGVPAVTVSQPMDAMETLVRRANENGAPLYLAPPFDAYNCGENNLHLGIAGSIQKHNATLALQLCRIWINNHHRDISERKWVRDQCNLDSPASVPELDSFDLCSEMKDGLTKCSWPGRNQTLRRPGVTYFLDGAHTVESIQQCASWFQDESDKEMGMHNGRISRVLIFNSTKGRNPVPFLSILKRVGFDAAVFCPNLAFTDGRHNRPEQDNRGVTHEAQLSFSLSNKQIWDDLQLSSNKKNPLVNQGATLDIQSALNRDSLSDNHWNGNVSTFRCAETRAFPCLMQSLFWAGQGRDPSVKPAEESDIPALSDRLQTTQHVQVLVTGSMHLVGVALGLLDVKLW